MLILALPSLTLAQDEDLVYQDYIYSDNLRSVKFHVDNMLTSMPVLELSGNSSLLLSFDDMDSEAKNYVYTVEHCDANWKPSNLNEFDYIQGFSEGQIQDYDFSFKVQAKYTHYQLTLPNRDMQFTISGNYLLKVYEDEDERRLVLTRRFLIIDNKVKMTARSVRPAIVEKITTHHEIDFTVNHETFEIRSPQQEISAVVLQNGRWDNAITGLKPLFSKTGQQLFDYQDKIVFPAGKEFRYIDLRRVKNVAPRIISLTKGSDGRIESTLEKESKRGGMPYFEWRDINGNFIIENADERSRIVSNRQNTPSAGDFITQLTEQEEIDFQRRISQSQTAEEASNLRNERLSLLNQRREEANVQEVSIFGENTFVEEVHNLQSEYIDVLFQLSSTGEMYDQDIYIFGGLTDWQLKPAFKMVYNPATNAYVCKVNLKQGYYEYLYAALPHGATKPDFEETEGDWHETDNYYTILVYYHPFGSRFDQLIGAYSLSSRQQ